MKNILIIIASLKHGGGAEKVATTIGSSLYEKGYNIHFLTFYDVKDKYEFKGQYYSFNEKLSKNIFINIFKLFTRAYKIRKYCKINKINTTISHMSEANFSNILSKLLFYNNSKIIIQIHTSINSISLIFKKLSKILYPFSDKIISIVKEEKYNLINNYGIKKDKIKVIYNPIDLKNINKLKNNLLREKYSKIFNNGKFTFINVGRLSFSKNQELLINTFNKFNSIYNNTQLIILGDGELNLELINLTEKLRNKSNIYFLGKHNNIFKFLLKSDCFVMTSFFEGMPVSLLESIACGLPIISSDCKTGPKEILKEKINSFKETSSISVEKYGILFKVNDEENLYKAMEEIYKNKKLRESYKNIYKSRVNYFDIENIINKWIKVV